MKLHIILSNERIIKIQAKEIGREKSESEVKEELHYKKTKKKENEINRLEREMKKKGYEFYFHQLVCLGPLHLYRLDCRPSKEAAKKTGS